MFDSTIVQVISDLFVFAGVAGAIIVALLVIVGTFEAFKSLKRWDNQ